MSERPSDFELLRKFVRQADQAAFAEVVRRHLDLVYATALRKVEDQGAAEEVTQNVFSALARKAWRFAPDDSLPAWLYRTTLLEAKEWLRGELRRRRREQTAAELGTTMKTPDEQTAFRALMPMLDEALLSLREKDRTALLLRYYESQSLRDVGASLGVSEDTAQKRVAAALENVVRFFQRRGFRTATMATASAALQHTAISAPGFMAVSVAQAALRAAPVATGLTLLLARILSLTKFQSILLCVILASIPTLWYWHANSAVRQSESPQTRDQPQAAVSPKPQTSQVQNRQPIAQPAITQAIISRYSVPVVSAPSQPQKEYSVHLTGFINMPDTKIAVLEIRHQSSGPNGRPSITRTMVSEGKECGDFSTPDAHIRIEFLQADFSNLSARMADNGEEVVYTLDGAGTVPLGQWNVCLVNADFGQVVDLYAELMNRTILCHPGVKAMPVSAVAEAKDRAGAVPALSNILLDKTQTATIMDGNQFAVLAPTNRVKAVAAALEKIPYPEPVGPTMSGGSVNFVNVPMPEVLEVYGEYIGRKDISRDHSKPMGVISFHNQTPITKPEIMYAFDVLLSWQGWKASFIGTNSFEMTPIKAP